MRWLQKFLNSVDVSKLSFIAVDLETTGLDPTVSVVTEIGWAVVERGKITSYDAVLVKPNGDAFIYDHPLCRSNFERSSTLLNAVKFPKAYESLMSEGRRLQSYTGERCALAFHNAAFDVSFINCERARCGMDSSTLLTSEDGPFSRRLIDTQAMVQHLVLTRELKSSSLKSVCEMLGVTPGTHRAADDAKATATCVLKLLADGWL